MARQQISSHYSRLLTLWPKDRIRPAQNHFQSLLRRRIDTAPTTSPSPSRNESKEVNAAYLLLDGAFSKQFRLGDKTMRPASNETHYADLKRELELAPDRTWLGNQLERMKRMVRWR